MPDPAHHKVVVDPDICNGRPTVEGTRVAVQAVLELLSAGDSVEDVPDEYPTLNRDDVLACLASSARLMGHRYSLQAVA